MPKLSVYESDIPLLCHHSLCVPYVNLCVCLYEVNVRYYDFILIMCMHVGGVDMFMCESRSPQVQKA